MADRRQVRRTIKQLQRVQTWQLLVLLLLMCFLSATFLRLNNIGMSDRREAVIAADKEGDIRSLQNRLYELQRYSSRHMNATTGPIDLAGQYERDAQKAIDLAKEAASSGPNINALAEATCKPRFTTWSQAYVQCFADELAKFPPSPDPSQNVNLPSAKLYRHSYVSPVWTPDFAGWSVVVCLVIALMILVRILSLSVLRLMLKSRYRGV